MDIGCWHNVQSTKDLYWSSSLCRCLYHCRALSVLSPSKTNIMFVLKNQSFNTFIVRFFYLVSKTNLCLTPISTLPSLSSLHDHPSIDIDSPIDVDNDESDSALTPSPSKNELVFPRLFEMKIHLFLQAKFAYRVVVCHWHQIKHWY